MRRMVLQLGVLWTLAASPSAFATTFVVSNSNDSGPNSLRDAITQANAGVNATAADPDTILLTKDVLADIAPKTPFPTLASPMTFIGPDSLTVQIKGAKTFRAFSVAAGATVRMMNLRLASATSPDVGGYLLNAGDLTLVNVNIRNCDTQRTGAAIENVGTLTLINSWFDKNKVHGPPGPQDGGGAISNDEPGVLTAYNCTFSNNVCTKGGFGGTIRSASAGGVWLYNCTIALGDTREPTPAGGGIATIGTGVTHLNNTIVIGSVHGGDLFGPVQSELGHNLFGTTAGATLAGSTDGNIVGALMSSVIEPTLEHNGVSGRTHALIPGSPALDAGVADPTSPALATDARGFTRPANGAVDIGAFEEQQPLGPNLVTNASFEGTLHGWTASEDAAVTPAAAGMAGTSAVHVTAGHKLDPFDLEGKHPPVRSTVAGQRYRFSAFVRSDSSHGQASLHLDELHHDKVRQSVDSPAVPLTPDWQLVTVELKALRNGSEIALCVRDSPVLPNEAFDVDLVSVRPVLGPDTPPRLLAPNSAVAYVGLALTLDLSASDADGDTIAIMAADVSSLPSASTFVTGPGLTSGEFTWTPGPADTTGSPFPVTFSVENARTAHVITSIQVLPAPPDLAANPGFEAGTSGWGPYSGSILSLSTDAHSGASALLVTGPPKSTSTFGCTDTPNAVSVVDADGARYRFMAWVKASAGTGTVKLRVREYRGSHHVGQTQSTEVPLSAGWQLLSVDDVASAAGNTLDLRITEEPSAAGASFLVDDVMILELGGPAPVQQALVAATDGAGDAPAGGDAAPLRIVPLPPGQDETGFRTIVVEGLGRDHEASLPSAQLTVGAVSVAAEPSRTRTGTDVDGNGIEEVAFSFPEGAWAAAPGRSAEIEIDSGTSRAVRLAVDLDLVAIPAAEFRAWLPRDPVRSEGTLVFTTTRSEPVRVALFDAGGRRVKTLVNDANVPAGRHTLAIGGRAGALRSGVYFYRIATGEGVLDGHFALIQ